jgi:hypothetical protein
MAIRMDHHMDNQRDVDIPLVPVINNGYVWIRPEFRRWLSRTDNCGPLWIFHGDPLVVNLDMLDIHNGYPFGYPFGYP